jgi:hypothetical protein
MTLRPKIKAAFVAAAFTLLLDGCRPDTDVTGHGSGGSSAGGSSAGGSGAANGSSSTGTTGGATGSSTGFANGGSSGSGTGGSASSGTGTTAGSPTDAGVCFAVPRDTLETSTDYGASIGDDGMGNAGDLDGDGMLDLVVGGHMSGVPGFYAFFGLPDGGLSASTTAYFPEDGAELENPILLADLDGDGRAELLYVGGSGIEIASCAGRQLQQRGAAIESYSALPTALAVGDLDRDGIADIVDGEPTALGYVVSVFLGEGDGGYSTPIPLGTVPQDEQGYLPSTLFLVDLNQDGFLDVVGAAAPSSQLGVLLHESDGGYRTSAQSFPGPVTAAVKPRNGGAPDLVVAFDTGDAGSAAGVVQILANNGDGTFAQGAAYFVPNNAEQLLVWDFDGDCVPDIAVASNGCPATPGLSVLFGNSGGGFARPLTLSTPFAAGPLTILGPAASPHALATAPLCGQGAVVVYGDASQP